MLRDDEEPKTGEANLVVQTNRRGGSVTRPPERCRAGPPDIIPVRLLAQAGGQARKNGRVNKPSPTYPIGEGIAEVKGELLAFVRLASEKTNKGVRIAG